MGPVKMNCKSEARNKFKIGPTDSPPFGRGPSFECSNVQNPAHQDFWQFGFSHLDFGNSDFVFIEIPLQITQFD